MIRKYHHIKGKIINITSIAGIKSSFILILSLNGALLV